MPVLILLPLSLVLILVLLVALWPLAIYQRLRRGGLQRQLQGWRLGLQLGSALLSTLLLLVTALIAGHWWQSAFACTAAGLAIGLVLGLLARWPARVVSAPAGLFVTPSRALVMALLALVLLRLGAGLWQGSQVVFAGAAWPQSGWLSHAGLLGLAAVVLGNALGNLLWMRHEWRRHCRLYRRASMPGRR